MSNLLNVKDLYVSYGTDDGVVRALNGLTLSLDKGESLGLVGETGAGKSTLALSILRLLPDRIGRIDSGTIEFEGKDVLSMSKKEMKSIRGDKISMIFQDPMTSLNPTKTVGKQLSEVLDLHFGALTRKEKAEKVDKMFRMVGIPPERQNEYPFQFSGGMKQRIGIAMALIAEPELLIAYEPTTALDVTIQAQILELIADLQKKMGMAVILVTHDLGVIADMCDNIIVMYGGHICERGTADEIFYNSRHEYTKGLLRSIPNVNNMKQKLIPIAGTPINILNLPAGCAFCTRCDEAMKICLEQQPEEMVINDDHYASCWMNVKKELEKGGAQA